MMWIQSLGKDPLQDPLKEEMPPTPVFFPGISGTEEPGRHSPFGPKASDTMEHMRTFTYTTMPGCKNLTFCGTIRWASFTY